MESQQWKLVLLINVFVIAIAVPDSDENVASQSQPRVTGAIIDALSGVDSNNQNLKQDNSEQSRKKVTKIRYYPVYVPFPYPDYGSNYNKYSHSSNYYDSDYSSGYHKPYYSSGSYNSGYYRNKHRPSLDISYVYEDDDDDDDDDHGHYDKSDDNHESFRSLQDIKPSSLFRSYTRQPYGSPYRPPYPFARYH